MGELTGLKWELRSKCTLLKITSCGVSLYMISNGRFWVEMKYDQSARTQMKKLRDRGMTWTATWRESPYHENTWTGHWYIFFSLQDAYETLAQMTMSLSEFPQLHSTKRWIRLILYSVTKQQEVCFDWFVEMLTYL